MTIIYYCFWHKLEHLALSWIEICLVTRRLIPDFSCIGCAFVPSFGQALNLTIWFALCTYLLYMSFARALSAAIHLAVALLLRGAFNSMVDRLCFSQKFQVK